MIRRTESRFLLLGKPRLQPWPSQTFRGELGFSPWGLHLFPGLTALVIALALAAPTASAERTTISVPNIGRVSLDFKPAREGTRGFASIEISSAGHKVRFTPKTPIARIPSNREEILSSGLPSSVPGLSVDPSRLFFRGQFMSDSEPHTLLFFVSEGYASNASPLFVVGFTYMGEPYKVLQLDKFDMIAFHQASDNTALIIGKQSLSEVMAGDGGNGSKAPYATTYDPYSVYIVHVEGTADYSLAASKLYNQQHYVWAGPRSREDYAVLYNLPGHPKPMGAPASRIEALLGNPKAPKTQ